MRRVFAAVPAVLALMALVPSIHAVEGEVGAPGLALNLGGRGKSPRTLHVRLGSKAMSGTGAEVFRIDEAMPGLKRVRRKWETFHLRERPVRGRSGPPSRPRG